MADASPRAGGFAHPALFYSSDEDYLAALVPFVVDGVKADQPVAAAVPGARLRLLRDALGHALGPARARVALIDMAEAGRNPGRIIARVLRDFADPHPDRHVRIVGEPIWPGRSELEYPACVQHEALINTAFAGRNVTIVCPYDTSRLAPEIIADARATHPELWEGTARLASEFYAPDAVVDRYNRLWSDAQADDPGIVVTGMGDIGAARRHAAARGQELGLSAERISDLRIIATELLANSVNHAGGTCGLRVLRASGYVVCEVSDDGQLTDRLAGRRPATPHQLGGRGLLLINDLADLVRVHTGPDGTTIAALLALPAQPSAPSSGEARG